MSDELQRLGRALGGLGQAMTVVTAASPSGPAGCLVGFWTQSSLDPVRLTVFLSRANHTYAAACDARALGVHVLDAGQRELAELFGTTCGAEVDKFASVAYRRGPHDVPVLEGTPMWCVGEVVARVDGGDHEGFVLAPLAGGVDGFTHALSLRDVNGMRAAHR